MHWAAQFGINAAVAGVVVGGAATLLLRHKSDIAGFLYGVAPVSFLYLYIYTWVVDAAQVPVFAWHAALGGVFWLFFVTVVGYVGYFGRASNAGSLATGLLLAAALVYVQRRRGDVIIRS